MMLIEESKRRKVEKHKTQHRIRIIANAAGGLLPSIAEELKQTFGASTIIMPSYGMTECMPISCPPSNYKVLVHCSPFPPPPLVPLLLIFFYIA